ncbi:MAG: hypothetical protein AAF517_01380 [Planctomycetota bacterium]
MSDDPSRSVASSPDGAPPPESGAGELRKEAPPCKPRAEAAPVDVDRDAARKSTVASETQSPEAGDHASPEESPRKKRRRRRRRRPKKTADAKSPEGSATESAEDSEAPPRSKSEGSKNAGSENAQTANAPFDTGDEEIEAIRRRAENLSAELHDLFYALVDARRNETGLDTRTGGHAKFRIEFDLERAKSKGDPNLFRQVSSAAAIHADRTAIFPSGHVFCYWCQSFRCEHSTPPGPRSVFGHYSATGLPVWTEFSAALLDRADPRIDLLYGPRPSTLPLTQSGGELASQQLKIYGKRSAIYRIIGQVSLGYLNPPRHSEISEPFALTVQAVEVAGGRSPAHLNLLAHTGVDISTFQALEEFFDPRIVDAITKTRRRLAEISIVSEPKSRKKRGTAKARQAMDALRLLAKNFDRIFRQSRRRTQHSQDRHRERSRPASSALQDGLSAKVDSVYRDVEEQTWVVVGPKNRVHVFNDEGLHVTSVAYPGETVRQRTTKGRWVSVQREEKESFLARLREQANADSD